MILVLPVSPARAVTSAEVQAEADAAAARLAGYEDQLSAAEDAYWTAMNEHDAAIAARDEAQATIEQLQGHLSVRASEMYKNGSSTFLDVLLGAATFEDFANTWGLLNGLNEQDAADVEATRAAKAEYEEQEAVAAQKLEEAEQAQSDAAILVEQTRAEYDSLSAEAADLLAREQAAAQAEALAAAMQAAGVGDVTYDEGSGEYVYLDSETGAYGSVESAFSSGGTGSSGSALYSTGSSSVDRAYACLGVPYVYGTSSASSFDCSGLVSYALTGSYGHAYTSSSLMGYEAVSDPQPGDICVKDGHCGVYIGGGSMIHAPTEGQTVCVTTVQDGMKIVRP